jgi:hypothetical protein
MAADGKNREGGDVDRIERPAHGRRQPAARELQPRVNTAITRPGTASGLQNSRVCCAGMRKVSHRIRQTGSLNRAPEPSLMCVAVHRG